MTILEGIMTSLTANGMGVRRQDDRGQNAKEKGESKGESGVIRVEMGWVGWRSSGKISGFITTKEGEKKGYKGARGEKNSSSETTHQPHKETLRGRGVAAQMKR